MKMALNAVVCSVILTLAGSNLYGAEIFDPELNGLILNQTRTRFGNEFYRSFCEHWGETRLDFSYTIVVREITEPRWGSLFIVEVNGREAYRKPIQPRSSQVEGEVLMAIPRIRNFLLYLMRTDGNGDFEELKGSGL